MSRVPQSDQMRASGSARRKVALSPGRSQLDWVRNSGRLPRPYQRPVSLRELRAHKSKESAWMAINGRVFDVTPYIEYHPGGVEMMLMGAGKDATSLFNKYHSWVNPEYMLARCYLGPLDASERTGMETASERKVGPHRGLESDDNSKQSKDEASSKRKPSSSPKQAKASTTSLPEVSEHFDALNIAELEE